MAVPPCFVSHSKYCYIDQHQYDYRQVLYPVVNQLEERKMLGENHDLVHELPEHKERIHELKKHDKHFQHLYDKYHDVNNEIIKIEEGIETPSDEFTEKLKKERLHLKDQLLSIIVSAG
jgi:uncharacterized protein YdcH (DUF465 family)